MQRFVAKKTVDDISSPFWRTVVFPVLRYRKMIYLIVATSVVVTVAYCLIIPNKYTSTATILPSGHPDQLTQLSQIATGSLGDLGIGSMIQAPENSSVLYPKVLSSRLISEKVLGTEFTYRSGTLTITETLDDYIGARNRDLALRELSSMVDISLDRSTGVVTLAVTTEHPELSADIVHAYLEELNVYNVSYRQSKARDNELFIASRLEQVKTELTNAEDSLRAFQEENLNYLISSDPTLRSDLSRLQREVSAKEALYLSLTEKYELAKLEAAKDIPVVQVLDRGSVPAIKTSPHRSVYVLGALIGSFFAAIMLALALDIAKKRQVRGNLESLIGSSEVRPNRLERGIGAKAGRLQHSVDGEHLGRGEREGLRINESHADKVDIAE